jgi:hypothetical protein
MKRTRTPQSRAKSELYFCLITVLSVVPPKADQLSVAIKLFSLCYGRLTILEEKEDE